MEQGRGDLIDELEARGLVQTLTSRSLRTHLAAAPRVVYSGVDPSASSLHVGNLLPLLTLAHFARYGHRPIVLVGGATGSIGDPSGRSTERNALDKDTLTANVNGIKSQLRTFFHNVNSYYTNPPHSSDSTNTALSSGAKAEEVGEGELGMGVKLMNNYDWMAGVSLLDFLGSVGRHARLTQMLARDSVASRLQPTSHSSSGGMSYTEFSYQLLQAYDFSYLHRTSSCTVQLGGSDQLGNISAGIDLIRRTTGGLSRLQDDPAYGLTLPLLTTASGEKFGKSAGNAVWLDPLRTSDVEFYQFFLRSSDADVAKYLRALTLLPPSSIEETLAQHAESPKRRVAQRVLADHITRLIRGEKAAEKSKALTDVLFSHTTTSSSNEDAAEAVRTALERLNVTELSESDGVVARLSRDRVVGEDLTRLAVGAGLVKSRAEAKRMLAGGALYVNNRQINLNSTEATTVQEHDLVSARDAQGGLCLLRAGKNAVRIVHVV